MSYNTISDDDFSFVENPQEDFYGVKLKGGQYNGVIVVYGKVSILEDTATDTAKLSFTYTVQDSGKYQPDQLEKDEAFNNYLGELLTYFVTSQMENDQEQTIGSEE